MEVKGISGRTEVRSEPAETSKVFDSSRGKRKIKVAKARPQEANRLIDWIFDVNAKLVSFFLPTNKNH